MALGAYKDIYTVPEFTQRVSDIQTSIYGLKNGKFLTSAKNKVQQQIEILKSKEQQLIAKFQIDGVKTLEDLNRHLSEYRKITLNLSGPALVQTFTGILEAENDKEFAIFNQLVTNKMNELISDKPTEERMIDWAYQKAMEYLNQNFTSSKGINTSFHSKKGYTEEGIFPANFTKEQKKRWKKLIAEESRPKGIDPEQWEMDLFSSGESLTATFNWFSITDRKTQLDAQKMTDQEVNNINTQIKNAIIFQTGDAQLIGNIIDHVLGQNRFAFFVGKNVKDITGVLGEIQGLYYLSKLFGGVNATKMPAGITWRGGTFSGDSNTKPHQDILFDTFGIQVKNSTKDLIGSISFANASIETMLNKTGLSEEAKNVFYNFYGTKEFNVPYHREGKKYLSGLRESDNGAMQYKASRQALENCEKDIEELLSLFAASFMYMDIAEDFSLADANVLYLVGGTAFHAASSILQQILDELEAEAKSFKITSSTTLGYNIIDALNSGKRDYSSAMQANVRLTSSYKF